MNQQKKNTLSLRGKRARILGRGSTRPDEDGKARKEGQTPDGTRGRRGEGGGAEKKRGGSPQITKERKLLPPNGDET